MSGVDSHRSSSVLPPSLPPRGLSRREAAAYIGVGVTKFNELVVRGLMPPPKAIDGRCVWDRHQVDIAFEALPNEGGRNGALKFG